MLHRSNFIIQEMNSVGQAAAEWQPAENLQRLPTRISFIQDTDAL